MTASGFIPLLPYGSPKPYFFYLYPFYQVHNTYKQEKCRPKTGKSPPTAAIESFHWSFQPFSNQVHAGHHHQGREEREHQTKDDGPTQRTPEHHTIAAKENIRFKVSEQSFKIDIETNSQWQQPASLHPVQSVIQVWSWSYRPGWRPLYADPSLSSSVNSMIRIPFFDYNNLPATIPTSTMIMAIVIPVNAYPNNTPIIEKKISATTINGLLMELNCNTSIRKISAMAIPKAFTRNVFVSACCSLLAALFNGNIRRYFGNAFKVFSFVASFC